MNDVFVNMVLRSVESDSLFRVIWVSPDRKDAYVFNLETQEMPEFVPYAVLQRRMADGTYAAEETDPYFVSVIEGQLSDSKRQIRDKVWALMYPIVIDESRILDKRGRNAILAGKIAETGKTRGTFQRYLKAYWLKGKTKNAFIPEFHKRGGKGVEHRSGEAKMGRPRKYGDGAGVNVDDAMKEMFESAIKKYYHTRNENTLQYAYDMMIKERFTHFVPQPGGGTKAELLSADKLPTIAQFRYWYNKKHGVTEKLTKRRGETKFALEHRAITGKSDYGVMGPCAKYQIDATIGDVYLVSRFNRADIIGRPIIYFVIDVFSRMVAGMYVGLEGPSRNGSMMAIANACSDKVKYCAEYGVTITDEEWPCRHVPNAILGDRGEMESASIDTVVNALNVRVENAVAYRGDMKGIIEQQFHKINETAIKYLPGHVKPDMNERGAEDYRLSAKLDIYQLTKILIQCVLYHNNHHLHKTVERTADMISDDVPPIPLQVWNWGITHCSGALRSYPEETVKLALMPTDTATVTGKGIRFNGLYYLCDRAVNERWLETARAKGSFKVSISYDSRNMSRIYIREADGSVDVCKLTEWQEKYTDKCLEEIIKLHESERATQRKHEARELASKADLFAAIDGVIAEAEDMARQTPVPKSKAERVRHIRGNRRVEKEANRRDEAFEIGGSADNVLEGEPAATPQEGANNTDPRLALIKLQLEERLHGR